MLSPFMESLNGEGTVIQWWEFGYYPGRWKDLTKEAFARMLIIVELKSISHDNVIKSNKLWIVSNVIDCI